MNNITNVNRIGYPPDCLWFPLANFSLFPMEALFGKKVAIKTPLAGWAFWQRRRSCGDCWWR